MKKNLLLHFLSAIFFIAGGVQAQEWYAQDFSCYEENCCVDETNVYAKVLGGVNFLQNTSIDGNKTSYLTGCFVGGSLGYCCPYGLRVEGEYAYRRNSIRKIRFFGEGSSNRGYFKTSSVMANLLWDLPLSSLGGVFCKIQPLIGAGIGYDYQQMRSSNSRIVLIKNGTIFPGN